MQKTKKSQPKNEVKRVKGTHGKKTTKTVVASTSQPGAGNNTGAKRVRKPLTAAQRARKNHRARLRRAEKRRAEKAALRHGNQRPQNPQDYRAPKTGCNKSGVCKKGSACGNGACSHCQKQTQTPAGSKSVNPQHVNIGRAVLESLLQLPSDQTMVLTQRIERPVAVASKLIHVRPGVTRRVLQFDGFSVGVTFVDEDAVADASHAGGDADDETRSREIADIVFGRSGRERWNADEAGVAD